MMTDEQQKDHEETNKQLNKKPKPETDNYITIPKDQYKILLNSANVSIASMLNTLDEFDDSLGEALKLALDIYKDNTNPDPKLGDALSHAVNLYLRRDRTKKQIQVKSQQQGNNSGENKQQT